MTLHDTAMEIFAEALLQQGFSADNELGCAVTYRRENDSLKVHLGSDGSFTALDGSDEVIGEGKTVHELYAVLVAKPAVSGRINVPGRGTSWSRHRPRQAS